MFGGFYFGQPYFGQSIGISVTTSVVALPDVIEGSVTYAGPLYTQTYDGPLYTVTAEGGTSFTETFDG